VRQDDWRLRRNWGAIGLATTDTSVPSEREMRSAGRSRSNPVEGSERGQMPCNESYGRSQSRRSCRSTRRSRTGLTHRRVGKHSMGRPRAGCGGRVSRHWIGASSVPETRARGRSGRRSRPARRSVSRSLAHSGSTRSEAADRARPRGSWCPARRGADPRTAGLRSRRCGKYQVVGWKGPKAASDASRSAFRHIQDHPAPLH